MNIRLIYNKSSFNIDIMNDTPCQYLFEVTHKIFRIPMELIKLSYEDIEIKNNSRLIFSVMGKTDPDNINDEETIIVSKRKKRSSDFIPNSNSIMLNNNEDFSKLPLISSPISDKFRQSEKLKNKKKGAPCVMKCQICNHKNSIFYCRVCNLFICFECNVRFNEHRNHERINLEDGDSFLGCDVYREEIINEINIIELGYQKTLEWMIDNQDRENFLQGLFKVLEQIRNNSLALADMKTLYNLDQQTIDDFRIEVDKIPKPKHREDVFDAFGNLNLKENELRNYTKFLNLQIIKTEYNKVLLKCLDKVKKNFDKLSGEVKSRLSECEDVKFRGLEDVQLYLKESKFEHNQMTIVNYLSKDYLENNNRNTNNLKSNLFFSRKVSMNNNNSINKKNTINNFNNYYSNTERKLSKDTKENITIKKEKSRNNNSLYDKEMSKTIDKRNMPIKLVDSQEKKFKMKKLNSNNNFYYNENNLSSIDEDLAPLKANQKKVFKIKDNLLNKVTNENPNAKKINLTTVKQQLSEADIKRNNNLNVINSYENKNDNKNDNNNNENKIIDNNNIDTHKNKLSNSNTFKRFYIHNKMGLDDELIKPEDNNKNIKKKPNFKDSLYRKFTNSEKKIVLNPPVGIKNNSYGKKILKKKSLFEKS